MPISNNRQVIDSFFERMYEGNQQGMAELLDDDLVWWTPGALFGFSGKRGKSEVLDAIGAVSSLFPQGLKLNLTRILEQGDEFAIEAVGDAVTTTGLVYKNVYVFTLSLKDGRIIRFHEYMDTGYSQAVLVEGRECSAPY